MTPITNKLRENWIRWYKHALKRPVDAPIKKLEGLPKEGHRRESEVDLKSV